MDTALEDGARAGVTRVDQARAVAKDLLPWGGLAALVGSAVFGDLTPELKHLVIQWGPALLIILIGVQPFQAFVRATQRIAEGAMRQATATQHQAEAMTTLTRELESLPRRDDLKFQDLQVGQELILKKLTDLDTRLTDAARRS